MRAPAVHREALRRFPFETVLTPYSYRLTRDAQYARDFDALVEEVLRQDAGLMAIKGTARNLWREGQPPPYTTWYEPLDDQLAIDAAVAFVLARGEITGMCTPGDVRLLPRSIEAERRAAAITPEEAASVLGRVEGLESPFVRREGRTVPDWLAPLLDA
jgi:hypothetical protein